MKYFFTILATLLIAFLVPTVTMANEIEDRYDLAEKHIHSIIKSCENLSQEKWDTGNTAKMSEGTNDYIACLKNAIYSIANSYFVSNSKKNDFLEQLSKTQDEISKLYNHVYTGPCDTCPTMYQPMEILDTAKNIENILKSMLLLAYRHDKIFLDNQE